MRPLLAVIREALLVVIVALSGALDAGCSSTREPVPDAQPGRSCHELAGDWYTAILAVSTGCATDHDCHLVGSTYDCDCTPSVGGCGWVVNGEAYFGSRADELQRQFDEQACAEPAMCDCAPPEYHCNGTHCVTWYEQTCFGPLCSYVEGRWSEEVALLERSCQTALDCAMVGGPGFPGGAPDPCVCARAISGTCGLANNVAAISTAEGLAQAFEYPTCVGAPSTLCDCPTLEATCIEGTCDTSPVGSCDPI